MARNRNRDSEWAEAKRLCRLSDQDLRMARGNALNDLFALAEIGVAHHQVDVFLFEPGRDYLGRPECLVPGCGAALFLQQHEGFVFDPRSLEPERCTLFFDRAPPPLDRSEDDAPF